jgi:hypothetical protein
LPVGSWDEAAAMLTELYHAYVPEANPIRRNYMWQQIASVLTLCRWLSGEPVLYRSLVRNLMYADANPVGPAVEGHYRRLLDRLLTEEGYEGDLAAKIGRWREDRVVRGRDAVETLLSEQLAQARARTVAAGLTVAGDYTVKPQVVYGVPYNAYCDFMGNAIYINGDVEYTADQLKHLVCHEAFPGHMTHLAVRRQLVVSGRIPADAGLVITNTASSPVFEGIGDTGMEFINWVDTPGDRICEALSALQSISGLNAAHLLHAEGAGRAAVARYLQEHGFGSPPWSEARVRFLTFPLRTPFIYSYWRGWQGVLSVWRQVQIPERPRFLSYLYENMHSLDTLAQFADLMAA